MNYLMGIDIGQKGGAIFVPYEQEDAAPRLRRDLAYGIGFDEVGYYEAIVKFLKDHTITSIFIEEPLVHRFKPAMAIASNSQAFGEWLGFFRALCFPTPISVKISEWKKYHHLATKGKHKASKTDGLDILLGLGYNRTVFNRYGKTRKILDGFQDGIVDACLILEYGFDRIKITI